MSFLRQRWERNWPELRAALGGGFPSFVFARRPAPLGDAIPVFYYHVVDPARFEADLRFLRRNDYTTLAADELLAHLRRERTAPARAVVLTFDDGPLNLHRVTFPLLREHRHRAVAFIAPSFHFVTADSPHPNRPCTWDELREMHRSGIVDVQSHSLDHRYFPRWPQPLPLTGIDRRFQPLRQPAASLEDDLHRAREILEAELTKTVRHLAFPRFKGTPDAVRAGTDRGYRGFWCGPHPGAPANRPGDDGTRIVRLSGDFLRRLPGRDRASVAAILRRRYGTAIRGWTR